MNVNQVPADEDVQAKTNAALAKVNATPPPTHDWWEVEAGVWTFDPADDNTT